MLLVQLAELLADFEGKCIVFLYSHYWCGDPKCLEHTKEPISDVVYRLANNDTLLGQGCITVIC